MGAFDGLLVLVAVGEFVGASVGVEGASVGAIVGVVGAVVGVAVCWQTFSSESQRHNVFLPHARWWRWWLHM